MKEQFEWIHSWSDNAPKHDLPRVLLIGDSITNGFQEIVRKDLKDKVYVDHLVLSYSIETEMFQNLLKKFANDNKYDLIHFNFGLHGLKLPINEYSKFYKKTLKLFNCKNVVLMTSTIVKNEGNKDINNKVSNIVKKRNLEVNKIAKELKLDVDDLYEVSLKIDNKDRLNDGWHYLEPGYKIFAKEVEKIIKKKLKIK